MCALQQLVDPETGGLGGSGTGAVDATLAVGAIPIDVTSLGADLVYFAADRWLLAPEGTGAIWTRDAGMRDDELGRTQVLGLARSVGWLEMYVDFAVDLRADRASWRGASTMRCPKSTALR